MTEPLTKVLATHQGILVVLFTGPGSPAEDEARQTARAITKAFPPEAKAIFLEASLACRRATASTFGIHGAPAIALFQNGELVSKKLGNCHSDDVQSIIENLL